MKGRLADSIHIADRKSIWARERNPNCLKLGLFLNLQYTIAYYNPFVIADSTFEWGGQLWVAYST